MPDDADAHSTIHELSSADRTDLGRWQWAGLVILLAALYLMLRLPGLDSIVTTDEPFWLGRSANFYSAIWQGRFEDTFQHAHPGVTTMWAGMVGYLFAAPDYVRFYDSNLATVYDIHERLRAMNLTEMDVLNAARTSKIVLQAVIFTISLLYLRRLFGVTIAVVAGAVVALDPFLIGHDRVLHVDGLLAFTSLAAMLALADAVLQGPRSVITWVVAGSLAALAWLTRSTGVILVGVTGLVLLADALLDRRGTPIAYRIASRLRLFGIWSAAGLATSVLLWPALWAAPQEALSFVIDWATGAATAGHEHPIYFLGEIHHGDPGPLFYPVTIVWRLTVSTSIGLPLLAIVAIGPWRRVVPRTAWLAVGILLLFALLYLMGMTIGAKKFDRYVLPIYPMLDILAAIGVVSSIRIALSWRPSLPRIALPALLGASLLLQGAVTLAARPYYLDTYNPILGGTSAAADVMQLGWGEGVSEAAEFIMDDSGIQPADSVDNAPVARMSGGDAPLIYALPPPYIVESSSITTEPQWHETTYYVATVQQWQRDIFSDTTRYLKAYEPAHTVVLNGVEYVRVWDLREIPPPGWLADGTDCQWRFGSTLMLENVEHTEDGITLWFRNLEPANSPDSVAVEVELVRRSEFTSPSFDTVLSGTLTPGEARGSHAGETLDDPALSGIDLDAYLLRIRLVDTETGAGLAATGPEDTIEQPAALVSPDCGNIPGPE